MREFNHPKTQNPKGGRDLGQITHKQRILESGPKTNRWIDRAEWLYFVAERRGNKEHQDAAFKALSHFVEAQDLRRCYESCSRNPNRTGPLSHLLSSAAREHRRGVKAYKIASELIFPKG